MSYQPKLSKPPTYDRKRSTKQPLSRTVTVFMDDEVSEALQRVNTELATAESKQYAKQKIVEKLQSESAADNVLAVAMVALDEATTELRAVEEKVQAAYDDAVANHAASFRVVSCGRKKYDKLVLEHEPTEEQHKQHQEELGSKAPYNVDTFPPALLHIACVEPKLELWEWKSIFDWDELTDEELLEAWAAIFPDDPRNGVLDEDTRVQVIDALRKAQPEWNTSELVELTQAAIEVCTHRRVVSLGKGYG